MGNDNNLSLLVGKAFTRSSGPQPHRNSTATAKVSVLFVFLSSLVIFFSPFISSLVIFFSPFISSLLGYNRFDCVGISVDYFLFHKNTVF